MSARQRKPAKKPAKAADRLSVIDAAARVLGQARGQALTTRELIEAMAAKGLWKSPAGKTPHATLSSAIQREMRTKGKAARFRRTERGRFALADG
jgi:hypothetical protein